MSNQRLHTLTHTLEFPEGAETLNTDAEFSLMLKGIVHPKMTILTSYIHPHHLLFFRRTQKWGTNNIGHH